MSEGERMMLSDAIESCIIAERNNVLLKGAVLVLSCVCCALTACLIRR